MKGSRLARSTTGCRPPSMRSMGSSDELRLRAIERRRALGEAGEHIELRDRGGRGLQRRQPLGQPVEQLRRTVPSRAPARDRVRPSTLSSKDLSSGVMNRSADFTVCRRRYSCGHPIRLGAVDLDEEALHAIEAELQAGKPACARARGVPARAGTARYCRPAGAARRARRRSPRRSRRRRAESAAATPPRRASAGRIPRGARRSRRSERCEQRRGRAGLQVRRAIDAARAARRAPRAAARDRAAAPSAARRAPGSAPDRRSGAATAPIGV